MNGAWLSEEREDANVSGSGMGMCIGGGGGNEGEWGWSPDTAPEVSSCRLPRDGWPPSHPPHHQATTLRASAGRLGRPCGQGGQRVPGAAGLTLLPDPGPGQQELSRPPSPSASLSRGDSCWESL